MQKIGLIGLGNAGRPLAERILSKGYALTVFDVDPVPVDTLVQRGARGVQSAKDAVAEITLTVVPSSVEVQLAVFGENGAIESMRSGVTLIDLSGTDPDCARQIQSTITEKGARFIGGTIHASGAPAVVIPEGRFTVALGGKRETIDGCRSFLQDLAQTVICLPEPWMPKAFKIAVILYATINNITTAEICSWLMAQGADPKLFLKLLQNTGSQASATRMEEFMKRDNQHGGALSNSYKDFRQALQTAAKLEIPMPLVSMANQIQEMGRAGGFSRFNSPAAMGKLYELLTGIDLSGASLDEEKKRPAAKEPRIVFLDD